MPYAFLFIFGAVQFYTVFFLCKFIDYSLYSHFTLLTISICHLTSAWVTVWIPRFHKLNLSFVFLYPLAFVFLSQTQLGSSKTLIAFSIFIVLAAVQFQIFNLLTQLAHKFKEAYAIELAGALAGVMSWYYFSKDLGFINYAVICLFIQLLYIALTADKKIAFLLSVFTAFACFNISEPNPAINKRERYQLATDAKRPLLHFWDPNGHVELIEYPEEQFKSLNFLLFEGGDLRSNIFKFDGNYKKLRGEYEKSLAPGVWGLDVVLPHYMNPYKKNCALISAVGGQEILAAQAFECEKIFAIDINKSAHQIMMNQQKDFSGNLYSKNVVPIHQDGRLFIKNSATVFDLIQIYSAHNASYSGALGPEMQASSLFTAEALKEYESKLSESGILHITQPYFKKIYNTFEKAFGKQLLEQRKLLVIDRKNRRDGLVSFYYKKQSWSDSEVKKILSWLEKDPNLKWKILINPLKTDDPIDSDNKDSYHLRASTDSWPFSKLVVSPISYLGVKIAIGFLLFIFAAVVLSASRKKIGAGIYLLFLMGISFSINQFILISTLQKNFGNPAFGLMLGTVLTLLACFAGVKLSSVYYSQRNLFFTSTLALILALIAGFYQIRTPLMALLSFLIIVQSIHFTWLINADKDPLRFNFWINACGLFSGMVLANLIFVFWGQQAILLSLAVLYFAIFTKLKFHRAK